MSPRQSSSTDARVVRCAPVTVALVALGCAHGEDGGALQCIRRVRGLGRRKATVAERRAVPTMPGPIPHTTTSKPSAAAQSESRRCRDALDLTVEAGTDRDRRAEVPALAQEPERVGERDRQRSARELHVRDAGVRSDARAHRRDLAVERAADDGHPGQRRRQRPPLLCVARPRTGPACTGASSRARRDPPEGRARA